MSIHRKEEVKETPFNDENIDLAIDNIIEDVLEGAANAFNYGDNREAATKFLGRLKERIAGLGVDEILINPEDS